MIARLVRLTFCLVVLSALLAAGTSITSVSAQQSADASAGNLHGVNPQSASSSALMFVENVGQFDEDARYQVRGAQGTMWLTNDALWISVIEPAPAEGRMQPDAYPLHDIAVAEEVAPRVEAAIRLSFEGATPNPSLEPFERLDTTMSYLLGNDPAGWHADVPVWGGVRYEELYPGVDLEVGSENGELAMRLVTQDGATPEGMRLWVEGATIAAVGAGLLTMESAAGPLNMPLPQSEVPLTVMGEDRHANHVAVEIESSDAIKELSADKMEGLVFSTYLGGGADDWTYGLTLDDEGNSYLLGRTSSSDFPTTPGAYNVNPSGDSDVYVTKLSPDGSALIYSTFLGGENFDSGYDITIDGEHRGYLTGLTHSTDFPTTSGAFDESYNGGDADGFVARLSSDGTALEYSTFLGGGDRDFGSDIVLDETDNSVILAGGTKSSDYPTTSGALDPSYNGDFDTFVTKFDPNGSALQFSTFFGASGEENGGDIVLDDSSNIYLTGLTKSSNFPTTPDAYSTTYNGGLTDVYVAKLEASASTLLYSTYLGGDGFDAGTTIAVDNDGDIYISGNTDSNNFPITQGSFDTSMNGGPFGDLYVAKFSIDDSTFLYSTFLGSNGQDYSDSMLLDGEGNVTLVGYTGYWNFPITPNAAITSYGGGDADVIVAQLNNNGSALLYSTFLGGNAIDYGFGAAANAVNSINLSGVTQSDNFPTTSNVFDPAFNGGAFDSIVSRLTWEGSVPSLAVNYGVGAPGSYFTLNASNVPLNTVFDIYANNILLGTVTSDNTGEMTFLLSTANADPGTYVIRVGGAPLATITLDPNAPLRPQEGSGPIFELPTGIAYVEALYLPIVNR